MTISSNDRDTALSSLETKKLFKKSSIFYILTNLKEKKRLTVIRGDEN